MNIAALLPLFLPTSAPFTQDVPPPLAIVDVTLIDGVLGGARPNVTVQVRDRRIERIGPSDELAPGAEYRIVDGAGRYLIPGLWDAHTHVSKSRASSLGVLLSYGITSVRDLGGDVEELLRWREEIENGRRAGPHLFVAGPYLESAERVHSSLESGGVEPYARTRWPVADVESARAAVARAAGMGVDLIKVRTAASPEVYVAIGEAAREAGLPFAGHVDGVSPDTALEAGLGSIEHSLLFAPPGEMERAEWLEFAANKGTAVVPTLVNWHRMLLAGAERRAWLVAEPEEDPEDPRRALSAYLVADWREQEGELREAGEAMEPFLARYPDLVADLRELHAAGLPFLAGSDLAVLGIFPGLALHEELELLVSEIGLTPYEALLAATRRPADWLGATDLGRIAVGAQADLVLLERDPLEDVANTRTISLVVRAGRAYDTAALRELRERAREAPDVRELDWK